MTGINITITGTPRSPLVFPLIKGIAIATTAASGPVNYYAPNGPTLSSFSYSEGQIVVPGANLTSLTFNDLVGIAANFAVIGAPLLTTLGAPVLTIVGGDFAPSQLPLLTTMSLPQLKTVNGSYMPLAMPSLNSLAIGSLQTVTGNFNPASLGISSLVAPALVYVGGNLGPNTLPACTTMSFPSLTTVGGSFNPNIAALTSLSMPLLTKCGTVAVAGGNLANITLGTIGTTKSLLDIYIQNQALTQVSVDSILALLVSLDGTSGTTLWGAGRRLSLNGGTSSTPSAAGSVNKATLVARGAFVSTN